MKKYIYNHDYNTSNYFFICNQIKKQIKHYYLYYHLPVQQDFLDHLFIEIPLHDQNKICYQLLSYKELTSQQLCELQIPLFKKMLFYFYNIVRSMKYLLNINVITNFKETNLLLHGDRVFLTNFFDSLSLVNYNNNHGKYLFENIYSYCSWEFFLCHIIFVKNKMELNASLQEETITTIIDEFLKYHIVFKFEIQINHERYEDYFKKESYVFFSKYMNQPVQLLVDSLFKNHKYWDSFCITSYIIKKINESQLSNTSTIEKMEQVKQKLINKCLFLHASNRLLLNEIETILEQAFNE